MKCALWKVIFMYDHLEMVKHLVMVKPTVCVCARARVCVNIHPMHVG